MVYTIIKVYSILILLFIGTLMNAQDDELQPVEDPAYSLSTLIGSAENTIEKARIISETERTVSLEITYKGFKDKKYKIKASILSKSKKPLKEVETVIKELPGNSTTFDLRFEFKQNTLKTYTSPFIRSTYVLLNIYDADDSLGDLDLGGMNVFGNNFMYKLDKKWRISGGSSNTNIVVEITLTPFKTARNIKP